MVLPVAAIGGLGSAASKAGTVAGIAATAQAIAPYAQIAGSGLSAIGAISGGMAADRQAQFQSSVLRQQAEREKQDAAQKEEDFRRQQARLFATRRALLGGSGVEPSEGSPLLVSEDLAGESELQALRIRAGGQTVASRLEQNAVLQSAAGRSARSAGFMRGGALLLSGAGSAFGRRAIPLTA